MVLSLIASSSLGKRKMLEKNLQACNKQSARFGLSLTDENIKDLVQQHHATLHELRRVEFGSGPLEELITTFAGSPYLEQESYSETLSSLEAAFYQLKDSTDNQISDSDLIDALRVIFDEQAHGSTEYLADLTLETIKKALESTRQDDNADWSEYESHKPTEENNNDNPKLSSDTISRIHEGERYDRATNDYAAGFYDEQFELYRTSFDFNSRIGGSSL